MLKGTGMHEIFFGLKRAYWGSVAQSRKLLRLHWPHLTAARFDLMHGVRDAGIFGTLQSELRSALGVCRPVLTRMLKALVELGWLTRTRSTVDRRTYVIELTEDGKQVFESAYHRLVRSMRATRWVNQALIGMQDWPDKGLSFYWTECLDSLLWGMCNFFKSGGTLHYRWHPDD